MRFTAPALVALGIIACSRTSLETDPTALVTTDDAGIVMDDSGLGTKGDDSGGLGTKDAGEGTKDSGLGTKDSGLPTQDSGTEGNDSGSVGGDDSGSMGSDDSGSAEDSGSSGDSGAVSDAGGGNDGSMGVPPDSGSSNPCLACAEQKCTVQTTLCLSSPLCVAQGTCELGCLAAGKDVIATNLCLQSCVKSLRANLELIAAVSCGLTLCPQECLPILTSPGVP